MKIQLIIPVLNEAKNLATLLPFLRRELEDDHCIIVADGGSDDDSAQVCAQNEVVFFRSPKPGRGPQMNAAVTAFSTADIYYFLHADTCPPVGFINDILTAVEAGFPVGCYRFSFDSRHPLLAINAYFTRFNSLACRGGDQSLFVTRKVFMELGGFTPGMRIMEDYDFIERAQDNYAFRIIPRSIRVSARKYRANNYFRVQIANLIVFRMYRRGAPQQVMIDRYRALLREW